MYSNSFTIIFILFFFFNDTATTEIYTLSLHDALPISSLAEERPDPLFIPPPFGDDLLAALALEVAPLLDEDCRDVQLVGDDLQVRTESQPDLLRRRRLFRDRVEPGVEGASAFGHRLVEEVLLRVDVRVEGAFLDPHRLGEITDRSAVVALRGEEPCRLARQLGAARAHLAWPPGERVRNTSAAARWKPSGSPAAAKVEAISSLSPTQRQPLACADRAARCDRSGRSGSEIRHSSCSGGSTPSARASSPIASRSAAVPFVQAA